ncbi:hypothetical protein AVL62_02230 [Serinicoccus chungangensis]|uniref:DUF6318 domain-containing protein n=1 Tax=Serinicoccus chungangensis TaxID=767452 RepID=A0A0W8I5X4_9MICO|nr:DUF6318 family protein [Serinicoccus chungangensis]KUG53620.1 hypothetical protein AVL62_02230 [Serinicoccus chungangensis]
MRRTAIIAAAASLLLLPACTDQSEPSPMPTSEDALTTATEEPEEPDDVAATSEPMETDEGTSEPAAEGPPEMPAEAQEQTEEGAEAFALHYVGLINYTGVQPELGLLEPLAADDCESCRNHEDSVSFSVENGDYLAEPPLSIGDPSSIFTGESSRVAVPVEQNAQAYLRDGEETDRVLGDEAVTLIIRTVWNDGWLVEEITVEQ